MVSPRTIYAMNWPYLFSNILVYWLNLASFTL